MRIILNYIKFITENMSKTIEVTKITTDVDTIKYEIIDNTGLHLFKNARVEAWVNYHHTETFGFSPAGLPESILALPITLYLMPITWFYGVDLLVPSIDKQLHDTLPAIYRTYSKIYGPFEEKWRGRIIAKSIVKNETLKNRFDKIVFFSGGVDAVHAGIDNPGKKSVLVTVPSIEAMNENNIESLGKFFLQSKTRLIREFSNVSGSDWLMVTNNFRTDIFDDKRIQNDLERHFGLNSSAFRFDGWFGMKYLGNLLSSAPFAYAMGIKELILGSSYEQLENIPTINLDGSNPELTDSIKFAEVSFAQQDGLYTRRSQKVMNIVRKCNEWKKKVDIWVCFGDNLEQCGICAKCIRTQLNLLCANENPVNWGFPHYNEKKFVHIVRSYRYQENNPCWIWDIVDSIEDNKFYPYCDELLHWLKRLGYKKYFKRTQALPKVKRIFKIYRYPHYLNVLLRRMLGKK